MKILDVRPPVCGWKDIATVLGVSVRTAQRLRLDRTRRLRVAYDPFGRVFAHRQWLEDWAAKHTKTLDERLARRAS